MSEEPYTGYDPRKPKGIRMSLEDVLTKFVAEMPHGTKAYNLGCGQRPRSDCINVDAVEMPGVDLVADLFSPDWPIEDNSAGFVWMSHFLEHVPDWNAFWEEMGRICADNARVAILSPWFMSNRYWQDPTHCQPILDEKFVYLNREWRTENQIEHRTTINGRRVGYPDVNFVQEFNTIDSWSVHLTPFSDEVKQDAKLKERNAITDGVWFLRCFKTDESYKAYTERIVKDIQA